MGNKTHQIDKKDVITLKIKYCEAIQALQKYCFYKKHNNNKDSGQILHIN